MTDRTVPADPREAVAWRHRATDMGDLGLRCVSDREPWPCPDQRYVATLAARQDEPSPALRALLNETARKVHASGFANSLHVRRIEAGGEPRYTLVAFEDCPDSTCRKVRAALAANPPQTREADHHYDLALGSRADQEAGR